MFQYLIKRLLIALPVLLGVTIISFAIMQAAPGDYTDQFVGPNLSQQDIHDMKVRLGLDAVWSRPQANIRLPTTAVRSWPW